MRAARFVVRLALAAAWPSASIAQLVVPDPPPPRVEQPAPPLPVPYPPGGTNCNHTIADVGARAVLRAIDSCPATFFESRQAYYSYAKQAILGIAVPGATEAAGGLALEKAAENAFFCITGALIDESSANGGDKEFLKALLATAKENLDRAEFAKNLAALRQGLIDKGAAEYLRDGEVQTFIRTLDATLLERYQGRRSEIELADAGNARLDVPERAARELQAQAEQLARECRYDEAETLLAQAYQSGLEHLADVRLEVSRTKHVRYCLDRNAQQQRGGPFGSDSPFLRDSQRSADADITAAMRRDADYSAALGELVAYQRSLRAKRADIDLLQQRATRQLDAARRAAADCDWAAAEGALATVGIETLACALPLDDARRARDELAGQIEQAKQQFAALEIEQARIVAIPFAEVESCGALTLVADNFDQIRGQCREFANIDAKVAALRNRALACGQFKAGAILQLAAGTPGASLTGKVTLTAPYLEDQGERGFTRATYEDTTTTWERVDRANQKQAKVVWTYQGVPRTLTGGQAVTITVTGGVVSEAPPGAGDGLALSGVVAVYGDVVLKTAQQADRGHPKGIYEFIVNADPRNVEIHLGGAPAGTGQIWKYARP